MNLDIANELIKRGTSFRSKIHNMKKLKSSKMRGYGKHLRNQNSFFRYKPNPSSFFKLLRSENMGRIDFETKVKPETIIAHYVLGKGAFGQVWLVSESNKNVPYAMKKQSKKKVIEKNHFYGVLREKEIMESIDHPFVIQLVCSYQDKDYLYLITKAYLGGQLLDLLRRSKYMGLGEEVSTFYCACIVEGLKALHEKNVCYRDLKPENILLDSDGYCVIIDLGFAKVVEDKTYTLCGSPLYVAPEIVMNKGHNKMADIWSLGILVHELITGRSPFSKRESNDGNILKRICLAEFNISRRCSPEATDLILDMLVLSPEHRVGLGCNSQEDDIHNHSWFNQIDFNELLEKSLEAPWVPIMKDPFDENIVETNYRSLMSKAELKCISNQAA